MSIRVMLIDDDPDDAEIFEEALKDADRNAIFIYMDDPKVAFDKLGNINDQLPLIIFLDINMPTMNGWECLRKLKTDNILNIIPVIIYSTSSDKKEMDMALNLGAVSFMTKPHDFNDLKKQLRKALTNL